MAQFEEYRTGSRVKSTYTKHPQRGQVGTVTLVSDPLKVRWPDGTETQESAAALERAG